MSLAGCTCQETIDLRACQANSELCGPQDGDTVVQWTNTHAADWPQIDALLTSVPPESHVHEAWHGDDRAFWQYFGVSQDGSPELFIDYDGQMMRLRILTC